MAQSMNTNRNMTFFYPLIVYFVVFAIMNQAVLPMLPLDAVMGQALTSFVAGTVVYICFIAAKRGSDGRRQLVYLAPVKKSACIGGVIAILWLGCAGVAMNNVIAAMGLQQISDSYQQVEQAFYSSDLLREIIGLGVITPLAEELLYRQLVFYRLRESYGRLTAIAASALIFGVLHMNIVQTVYAFVLGLLLALLMENYQDVRVPLLGHIAANIIAILRGETEWLSWLTLGEPLFVPVTVILLAVTVVIAGYYIKSCKNTK